MKESTIWDHLAQLIEKRKLMLNKVLSQDKISMIISHIHSPKDKLKDIKARICYGFISYNDIHCVVADMKSRIKR